MAEQLFRGASISERPGWIRTERADRFFDRIAFIADVLPGQLPRSPLPLMLEFWIQGPQGKLLPMLR